MSAATLEEVERWVAYGYGQNPVNCKVLIAEITRLRYELRKARGVPPPSDWGRRPVWPT